MNKLKEQGKSFFIDKQDGTNHVEGDGSCLACFGAATEYMSGPFCPACRKDRMEKCKELEALAASGGAPNGGAAGQCAARDPLQLGTRT